MQPKYTQSANIDPAKATFGEKSAGVLALQQSLNKSNAGVAGYTPLKEDGLYGPLTQGATQFKNTTTSPSNLQSLTTLTSDKSSDITKNNNTLAEFSKKGITTDQKTGVATTADGNVYNPKITTADTSEEDNKINQLYDSMISSLDASTKSSIDSIKTKFDALRAEQRDINTRQQKGITNALLTGGVTGQGSSAQFAPISSEGIIGSQMSFGLKQIANLDAQEQELIASAEQAQRTGNFAIMEKKLADIDKKRQEKLEAATKLNEKIAEQQLKLQEQNMQVAKESAISDLYSQGITDIPTVMSELKKAGVNATTKEVNDTISLLSGIGGSGIVGEYNYYKSEAKRNGQVPMSFNEYQNIDANRKKSIAAAGVASVNGLDKEQRNRVAGLLDDYDKQAKDIKTVISQSNQITALSPLALSSNTDKGSRAAAQIGTIFSFMKMLDPTSTVREGEYATAQNTAGVDDKVRNAYNKVKDGSFLTDGQIKGYVNTGKALAESRKRQLEEIDSEFDRRSAIFNIPKGVISKAASTTVSENLIQSEKQKEEKITTGLTKIKTSNPTLWKTVSNMYVSTNPNTGQPYSASEILQAFPELQ